MSKNKDGKTATSAPDKLKRKKYEAELATLQAELVALQEWVKASGAKICIVFEGRDTARSFQDHVSLRILKGRCMTRPASRLASVMSRRPARWWAPTARLRRPAMTRGPELVRTVELSSR